MLPGTWAADHSKLWNASGQQRLLFDLQHLGREVEIALIDVGCGRPEVARAFWRAADAVLLVSDPDVVSIMDTYAAVKTLHDGRSDKPLWTVINRTRGESDAEDAHARLARACQRFLGLAPKNTGHAPELEPPLDRSQRRDPLALGNRSPEASQCFQRLVVSLLEPAARAGETFRAA